NDAGDFYLVTHVRCELRIVGIEPILAGHGRTRRCASRARRASWAHRGTGEKELRVTHAAGCASRSACTGWALGGALDTARHRDCFRRRALRSLCYEA